MSPLGTNQKIGIGVAAGVVIVIVVAVAAFFFGRGGSTSTVTVLTTAPTTPTSTVRTTTTSTTSTTTTPTGPAQLGPYTTMESALAFVQSQTVPGTSGAMSAIQPDETWRPDDILHVIHATPSGGASYGGDYYYFFANGYKVGEQSFTDGTPAVQGSDNVTFVVSFKVYNPGDPHCCPTGGNSNVRFRWSGSSLDVLDSLQGANME